MASGGIRVIEYEIVPWDDLDRMGDLISLLDESIKVNSPVGIMRCVTEVGRKVTFVGTADETEKLVKSGAASKPEGIALPKKAFPVMLEGWPYRLRAV